MQKRDAIDELLHLARETKVRHVADLGVRQHLKGANGERYALSKRGHVELVVEGLLCLIFIKNLENIDVNKQAGRRGGKEEEVFFSPYAPAPSTHHLQQRESLHRK